MKHIVLTKFSNKPFRGVIPMSCVCVRQSRTLKPLDTTTMQLCKYNAESIFFSLQCSKPGRVIFSSLSFDYD